MLATAVDVAGALASEEAVDIRLLPSAGTVVAAVAIVAIVDVVGDAAAAAAAGNGMEVRGLGQLLQTQASCYEICQLRVWIPETVGKVYELPSVPLPAGL